MRYAPKESDQALPREPDETRSTTGRSALRKRLKARCTKWQSSQPCAILQREVFWYRP